MGCYNATACCADGTSNCTMHNMNAIVNNWIIEMHFIMVAIIYYFTTARRYQS